MSARNYSLKWKWLGVGFNERGQYPTIFTDAGVNNSFMQSTQKLKRSTFYVSSPESGRELISWHAILPFRLLADE